ncbi:MAG: hypothetical protein H6620_11305 [Halobacteriovoraceae bacterium]|nr:hypothetical protein [Halobacteriovoraceae bacterium]
MVFGGKKKDADPSRWKERRDLVDDIVSDKDLEIIAKCRADRLRKHLYEKYKLDELTPNKELDEWAEKEAARLVKKHHKRFEGMIRAQVKKNREEREREKNL